ncbi:MAG TPA: hypothetical protein EYG03_24610 [Planctomycetes bacterium]|nr:hypothetical protein [Planctomycetota bacterium]
MNNSTLLVATLLSILSTVATPASADDKALELFKRRITPILRSPNPSSCSECHLSGVDLKDYIGDTQEETFAALRKAGLINMQKPDESKLLTFIHRTPANASPVGREARQQEFTAFRAWIRAAVKDPVLAAAKTDSDQLGPKVAVEIIRHGRQDRVMASFVQNIWSEVGRCVNCHSPDLNRKRIGRDGNTKEDIDAISWVVPRDPGATLQKLVDSGNIDLEDPDASPVLTKPVGLEEHGGGPKFALGSRTDKSFRRFLNDYAAVVNGQYTAADQIPMPSNEVAVSTGQHLRIVDLPARFGKKLLRADIYGHDGNEWSAVPWATAENPINGEREMWQSMVFATAAVGSDRALTLNEKYVLPKGRYLIKLYIDRANRLKKNRDYELGESEFYGQVETDGAWKVGYQPPKIIHAPAKD